MSISVLFMRKYQTSDNTQPTGRVLKAILCAAAVGLLLASMISWSPPVGFTHTHTLSTSLFLSLSRRLSPSATCSFCK